VRIVSGTNRGDVRRDSVRDAFHGLNARRKIAETVMPWGHFVTIGATRCATHGGELERLSYGSQRESLFAEAAAQTRTETSERRRGSEGPTALQSDDWTRAEPSVRKGVGKGSRLQGPRCKPRRIAMRRRRGIFGRGVPPELE